MLNCYNSIRNNGYTNFLVSCGEKIGKILLCGKKDKKNRGLKNDSKLIIELEDNAEELFERAIEGDWKPYEHEDEFFEQEKKSSKGKSSKLNRKIDLHGKTVSEAQSAVSHLMVELRKQYTGIVNLKVITGKGLHSANGVGVLGREIHDYISNKYIHNIIEIDDSPCDVLIHGVPIRGHFNVVLKF